MEKRTRIALYAYNLYTLTQNKFILRLFKDKRNISSDGITILVYAHYGINEDYNEQKNTDFCQ